MARALLLFRIYALLQGSVAITLDWGEVRQGRIYLDIFALLALVESLWFVLRIANRRSYAGHFTARVETATGVALLLLAVAMTTSVPFGIAWSAHTLAVAAVAGLGLGLHSKLETAGCIIALTTASATQSYFGHYAQTDPALAVAGPTALAFAGIFCAVATRLLGQTADRLDASWKDTLSRERKASAADAREQQRVLIHGGVLQTLEELCSPRYSAARLPLIQRQAMRDARALRAHLAGHDPVTGGLVSVLHALVDEAADRGVDAELLCDGILPQRVSQPALSALRVAASEALTNVAKHSGVSTATVRVEIDAEMLRLTVADAGRGCDLESITASNGFGVRSLSRLVDVGGHYVVDSVEGGGTIVSLWLPLAQVDDVVTADTAAASIATSGAVS